MQTQLAHEYLFNILCILFLVAVIQNVSRNKYPNRIIWFYFKNSDSYVTQYTKHELSYTKKVFLQGQNLQRTEDCVEK